MAETAGSPERGPIKSSARELLAAVASTLRELESGPGPAMAARVQALIGEAAEAFSAEVRPRGIWQRITAAELTAILDADGACEAEAPVRHVLEDAEALALFAATLGEAISQRIAQLFADGDPAGGYILDRIASQAADALAEIAARDFAAAAGAAAGSGVLPYSPGYCGWQISGQRALFARLAPFEIGLSLGDSCLMQPLKSVSGVLVLAPLAAHDVSPAFPCCAGCATLDCRERVAALAARLAAG